MTAQTMILDAIDADIVRPYKVDPLFREKAQPEYAGTNVLAEMLDDEALLGHDEPEVVTKETVLRILRKDIAHAEVLRAWGAHARETNQLDTLRACVRAFKTLRDELLEEGVYYDRLYAPEGKWIADTFNLILNGAESIGITTFQGLDRDGKPRFELVMHTPDQALQRIAGKIASELTHDHHMERFLAFANDDRDVRRRLREDLRRELPEPGQAHYRGEIDALANARLKQLHKLLYKFFPEELTTQRVPEVSLDEVGENPAPRRGSLSLRDSDGFRMERVATKDITANTTCQILKQMDTERFYGYVRARHETMRFRATLREILFTNEPTLDTRIRSLVMAHWHDFHHGTTYATQVIGLYRQQMDEGLLQDICDLAEVALTTPASAQDMLMAGIFDKEIRFMKRTGTGIYWEPRGRQR